jgi:hypothetical protein
LMMCALVMAQMARRRFCRMARVVLIFLGVDEIDYRLLKRSVMIISFARAWTLSGLLCQSCFKTTASSG